MATSRKSSSKTSFLEIVSFVRKYMVPFRTINGRSSSPVEVIDIKLKNTSVDVFGRMMTKAGYRGDRREKR